MPHDSDSPAQFAPGCFCVSADALNAMSPRHLAKTLAADTAERMAGDAYDTVAKALPPNVRGEAWMIEPGDSNDVRTTIKDSRDLYKNDAGEGYHTLDLTADILDEQNDRAYFTAASNEGKSLINQVRSRGFKITEEDVIGIVRDPMNKVVWLERGHLDGRPSGRAHIVDKHETDFFSKGITATDLDDFILNAVAQGKIVGVQGRGRTIYETVYHGKTYRVAVTIGDNGYIVGANPT